MGSPTAEEAETVTLIVRHRIRREQEQVCEAWLRLETRLFAHWLNSTEEQQP